MNVYDVEFDTVKKMLADSLKNNEYMSFIFGQGNYGLYKMNHETGVYERNYIMVVMAISEFNKDHPEMNMTNMTFDTLMHTIEEYPVLWTYVIAVEFLQTEILLEKQNVLSFHLDVAPILEKLREQLSLKKAKLGLSFKDNNGNVITYETFFKQQDAIMQKNSGHKLL